MYRAWRGKGGGNTRRLLSIIEDNMSDELKAMLMTAATQKAEHEFKLYAQNLTPAYANESADIDAFSYGIAA